MSIYRGPERRRGTRLEQHFQSLLLSVVSLVLVAFVSKAGGALHTTVSAIPVIKSQIKTLTREVAVLSERVDDLRRGDR